MSDKDRNKKDHERKDKKNKQMQDRENPQTLGTAPRHQAKDESNLDDQKRDK